MFNPIRFLRTDRSGRDFHGHKFNKYGIRCPWNPEGCGCPSDFICKGKCGECNKKAEGK